MMDDAGTNNGAERICGILPAGFSAAAGLGLSRVRGSLTVYELLIGKTGVLS